MLTKTCRNYEKTGKHHYNCECSLDARAKTAANRLTGDQLWPQASTGLRAYWLTVATTGLCFRVAYKGGRSILSAGGLSCPADITARPR